MRRRRSWLLATLLLLVPSISDASQTITAPTPLTVGGPVTTIFTGGTISTSSDVEITNLTGTTIALQYNITGTPSGGPSLTFTIAEADPQNPTTTLAGGLSASTSSITSAGSGQISMNPVTSSAIKVSWTVVGTFPSSFVTVTSLP